MDPDISGKAWYMHAESLSTTCRLLVFKGIKASCQTSSWDTVHICNEPHTLGHILDLAYDVGHLLCGL